MPELNWNADDFRNPQDSSGTSTEKISGGGLKQGYFHGSLTEGLVAYYPMDSGSGSTISDQALNNDGTINGVSWTTDSKIGSSCLSFDGTDDYVDVSHKSVLMPDRITVSGWVNFNDASKDWMMVDKGDSHPGTFYLYDDANDSYGVRWTIKDGSNRYDAEYNAVSDLNNNQWYHIAGTFDGKKARLYVDGVLVGSVSANFGSNSEPLWIGRYQGGGYHVNGKIDDVRIYNRPLSTPEIKALYNLERPSKVSSGDTLR